MSTTPAPKPSSAMRYLFLFLLGLVIGVIGVVMLLRTLEARRDWQDRFPEAAMHVMDAHMKQLKANIDQNRCGATDTLPHLQALRMLANDVEPAFPELRDDQRFVQHASQLRAALDGALATPPMNCPGVTAIAGKVNEACKACHQDFRN